MKQINKKLTKHSDHLDKQYGKKGTQTREKFEQEFETFKLGVMLQEMRKEKGMTQVELAEKCGTTKTYISRIENDGSNVTMKTLYDIVEKGLGGKVNISIEI
jgi:DNA-binding XRE family transcriptional regulator